VEPKYTGSPSITDHGAARSGAAWKLGDTDE